MERRSLTFRFDAYFAHTAPGLTRPTARPKGRMGRCGTIRGRAKMLKKERACRNMYLFTNNPTVPSDCTISKIVYIFNTLFG